MTTEPVADDIFPRVFRLDRGDDPSGVPGTGIVAYGVVWADGGVALRWCTDIHCTEVWDSLAECIAIHGHDGRTTVVFRSEQGECGGQ